MPKDVYGLIAIDNRDSTIALLKGDRYNIITKLASGYHGKHRAGGQSHSRFERIIKGQSLEFKVRTGEAATKVLLPLVKDLKGIIIGGPAGTKDDFPEFLNHELRKKVIAIKDITYTDESGIRELIDKSKDVLSEVQLVRQKVLMQRFMKETGQRRKLRIRKRRRNRGTGRGCRGPATIRETPGGRHRPNI